MDTIVIDAEPVEPVTLKLVGVEYVVTPPKTSYTMALSKEVTGKRLKVTKEMTDKQKDEIREKNRKVASKATSMTDNWIDAAFGDDQAKAVHKRLADPKDLLDIKHIMKLMTTLAEAQTEDPSM